MAAHSARITYLDGVRLYRAIVAGIRQVISKQEYLNSINVFPVPDRDTGTNMALTLNAILEDTYSHHDASIHVLLDTVANAALNGARGNSGAILAQFFQGLSEGAHSVDKKMTTQNFVAAISTAVNFAHRALSQPKEGTILTVLRDFSDEITHQQLDKPKLDFIDLLSFGVIRAEQSLKNTSTQLKELKKAGVVDAGAQGFVEFLNGIYYFVLNGSIKQLNEEINIVATMVTPIETNTHNIDERYRYCTECLINKKDAQDINQDELRQNLDEMGDSLIVAGSKNKTKIHIHSNDPTKIFEICRQYGDISGEKADDMIHQQKSFANRKNKVAILTDSSADLPESIIANLHIHVVPILINFGSQTFLDKISITPQEFHHALKTNPTHPTTSQPSFGDFYRQYQYLGTHYNATIALHIPAKLSGTLNGSQKAAEKSGLKNIIVLDTMNASASHGLIVMQAAEAAQLGYSQEKIIHLVQSLISKTRFYAAITQLEYLVRGGRLPVKLKSILDFLKLTPVITLMSPGVVKLATLLIGRKKLAEKIYKLLKSKIDLKKIYRISIVHTDCEYEANRLAQLIKNTLFNIDKLFVLPCCASLAVHAGPNALGVAILEYNAC